MSFVLEVLLSFWDVDVAGDGGWLRLLEVDDAIVLEGLGLAFNQDVVGR